MTGDYGRQSSVTSMLTSLKWTSLQERRRHVRLTMMHKVLHQTVAVPKDPLLKLSSQRTRSNHYLKLDHLAANTTMYKQSFFPRTIPEWNALPQSVVDSETADAFKCQLIKLIFTVQGMVCLHQALTNYTQDTRIAMYVREVRNIHNGTFILDGPTFPWLATREISGVRCKGSGAVHTAFTTTVCQGMVAHALTAEDGFTQIMS